MKKKLNYRFKKHRNKLLNRKYKKFIFKNINDKIFFEKK